MNSKSRLTLSAPYIYSRADSSSIMTDVIIALMPCIGVGIYLYGWNVLLNAVVCAFSSVVFEAVYEKMLRKPVTVKDMSAVVSGLILYLNMPVSAPLWMDILGCFIAIVIVKQLFGGIGRNFVNPALIGTLTMRLSFPAYMTRWTVNGKMVQAVIDAAGGKGFGPTVLHLFRMNADLPSDAEMFVGLKNGPVGQACAIAVLVGFVYLLVKKVVRPMASLGFLGTVALISLLSDFGVVFQLCAGGTLFFGVFMINDYTTSPVTDLGKIVYGIIFGLITMFFRSFSSFEDGISFALLFANLLVPYIDALTGPRPYGYVRGGGKRA